jgi:DnaJ domain
MAQVRDIVIADPFAVLGVAEDAGDDTIKQRYLALVRAFPPDREPERFQAYRRAYEAIRDARARAELRLLHATDGALTHLKRHCLHGDGLAPGCVPETAAAALITDGLMHVAFD